MAQAVIDADTHVRESDHTWTCLDPAEFPQRPGRLAVGEKKARFGAVNGRFFPSQPAKEPF